MFQGVLLLFFSLCNYITLSGYKEVILHEERSFYVRDRKAIEVVRCLYSSYFIN